MNKFGEAITKLRAKHNIGLRLFASMLQIDSSNYSKFERRIKPFYPTPAIMKKIQRIFELDDCATKELYIFNCIDNRVIPKFMYKSCNYHQLHQLFDNFE